MILDRPMTIPPGDSVVAMRIQRIPLNPGQYTLGLWAARKPSDIHDWIESAGEIEIHEPPDQVRPRPSEDGLIWTEFELLESP
jgi:hypothetical protein